MCFAEWRSGDDAQSLLIEEPKVFHSYLDEKHFFHWLEEIVAIKNVVGGKHGLTLEIEAPIDDMSLRDLIAVLTRYDVPRKCLASLCNEANTSWFKNPAMYWYAAVFE